LFIGERVLLRGLELSDVDELMKYWNTTAVKEFLYSNAPNSREEELEWIRNTWKKRREGKSYVFAIVLREKDLYIGNIEVTIMNQIARRGEIGIVIFNPNYWSQGLGSEALELLLSFSFGELNLNSVELQVFEKNVKAQKCYLKLGFKEVGRRRQALFTKGTFIDLLILDLLREEWLQLNST